MKRSLFATLIVLACLVVPACGQQLADEPAPQSGRFSNPIILGFAPNPSIVRVADDFYLINSTFEYFPGIPIYHSRDLVNWELISYALNDPEQIELSRIKSSDGIHASTIRHHEGTFYIITTNNVDGKMVNFIVTASDPRGPWSAPNVLEGAPGIDPSLFFDDGRAWYVGNHIPPDPEFPGQAEIWLQVVDIDAMSLVGERHYLWRGCCGGVWAEGPHIYKKDGYFYLLISEGGTAYEHALAIAISKEITGPYQNNPRNPVLSHRQLSYDYPITGVGHADLVELEDGRWYAVALGWQLVDGIHGILGRETFLLPVTWETEPYAWKDDKLTFPVFSPPTGKIELHYSLPFGGDTEQSPGGFSDDFDAKQLDLQWNFRRAPDEQFYDLGKSPGSLRIDLQAGADGNTIRLTQLLNGQSSQLAEAPFDSDTIFLKVTGNYLAYHFQYSEDGEAWTRLGDIVDGTALSPAVINGYNYTGVYVGLYASSNGEPTGNQADFEFFKYEPTWQSRDDWFHRQISSAKNP